MSAPTDSSPADSAENKEPEKEQAEGSTEQTSEQAANGTEQPTEQPAEETETKTEEQGEESTENNAVAENGDAENLEVQVRTEIAPAGARPLELEPYIRQKPKWPREGKHILAQFDQDSIVVYQAFKASIAEYAVENQQLGSPDFSFNRMSWIKTNFLWMMYRCGWATKANQEHVLAIRITREGFDEILSFAFTPKVEKNQPEPPENVVRLQWDPDHGPNGSNERRRAIQLGLKKDLLRRYADEFIVSIEDITDLVQEQHHHAMKGSIVKLMTPRERVYVVEEEEVARRVGVDAWEEVEEEEEDFL